MASLGYYVAPVRITLRPDGRKQADCGGVAWGAASTTDPAQIAAWLGPGQPYERWSYLIDTGRSGIVVADLDITGGRDGMSDWRALGAPSSAMVVQTRTGGAHGYYRADLEHPLHNSTGAVADGVDIRGVGGCVFGPGSRVEGTDQCYTLLSTEPVAVRDLPPAPTELLLNAMAVRGRLQHMPSDQDRHIQREQAYSNLTAAVSDMLATPIGHGLNTAIWRLGAEAGQYAGALGADEELTLSWVHAQVLRHPQIDALDADDLRAAGRGVSAGLEKPWCFFTLEDLIAKDFDSAGLGMPAPPAGTAIVATPDEINAEPEPAPLVADVIDAGSFGLLYGAGGSGKSFVALDIGLCVASGTPWRGHATTQGRVLYVAAEGRRSAGRRTLAWRSANKAAEERGAFMVYGQAIDLGNAVFMAGFAHWVAEQDFTVVVIDTYNRCTPDVEENSAKDAGRVVANIGRVVATGATVIVVHHTPKDGGGPRGSGALLWASDWALTVTKDKSLVTVVNARQKDRDDGETLATLTLASDLVSGSAALHSGVLASMPEHRSGLSYVQRAVLDVLAASDVPMTKTQLKLAVRGASQTDKLSAITTLVELGLVEADGGVDTISGSTVKPNGADRLRLTEAGQRTKS